ncbi:MAG: hypothetical protein ACRDWA_13840 [Acidimicrobiia bacterium]
MSLRPLMILGCTSNAGKSLLVTGLVRWFTTMDPGKMTTKTAVAIDGLPELEAITGQRPQPVLDFDLLADAVEAHLDTDHPLEVAKP